MDTIRIYDPSADDCLPRFCHVFDRVRGWCVLDRQSGKLHPCLDRGVAAEQAAMLDGVRRLLETVQGDR